MDIYYRKYLKYKHKYLGLKNLAGGGKYEFINTVDTAIKTKIEEMINLSTKVNKDVKNIILPSEIVTVIDIYNKNIIEQIDSIYQLNMIICNQYLHPLNNQKLSYLLNTVVTEIKNMLTKKTVEINSKTDINVIRPNMLDDKKLSYVAEYKQNLRHTTTEFMNFLNEKYNDMIICSLYTGISSYMEDMKIEKLYFPIYRKEFENAIPREKQCGFVLCKLNNYLTNNDFYGNMFKEGLFMTNTDLDEYNKGSKDEFKIYIFSMDKETIVTAEQQNSSLKSFVGIHLNPLFYDLLMVNKNENNSIFENFNFVSVYDNAYRNIIYFNNVSLNVLIKSNIHLDPDDFIKLEYIKNQQQKIE